MRIAALGAGGYFPSHGRQTMSYFVVAGERRVLLDAGSGVARLTQPEIGAEFPPGSKLDVLLTHYHLDHVVGLSYLPNLAKERSLTIHAPAPPLTQFGPEAIEKLLQPPLFPLTIDRWAMPTELRPYGAGGPAIDGLAVRVRAQRHPGGSVGVRIGDELAYVTDTVMDPATVDFARGVKLLLHEVWLSEEEAALEDAATSGHSDAGAVADLARQAGVGRLWVVHHHPRRSPEAVAAMAARMAERAGLPVEVPVEGRFVEIR